MSRSAVPLVKLNNGREMPALGLGTWQAGPGEIEAALHAAIECGYRHIDCAMLYGNEKEIGAALRQLIRDGRVRREDLFITTKLWNTFHEREQVVAACRQSLANFGFDYVDLYLVHWPVAQKVTGYFNALRPFEGAEGYDYDYVDTWKGMEECVDQGLARSIGISNFNTKQIDRILCNCRIKPVTNQIEVSLLNTQKRMIDYCKQRDMVVTAYSPFASPAREWAKVDDPKIDWNNDCLKMIARNHKKSVSQVILRYLVELGTVPIPKSTNPSRLAQNLDVFDFNLTASEREKLDDFNCDFRSIPAVELRNLPHYPFDDWILIQ